jgi:hypothetical protein
MKVYIKELNTIKNLSTYKNKYLDKLSIEQLNELGLYPFKSDGVGDRRYYNTTYTYGIEEDGHYWQRKVRKDKDLEEVQNRMLVELKDTYNTKKSNKRPKVYVPELDIYVDGGLEDIEAFNAGKIVEYPRVIDSEDNPHSINPETAYDYIIKAITLSKLAIWQEYRIRKEHIKTQLNSVEACRVYENTEVVQPITLRPLEEFTSKEELDMYGLELGITLDGRKTIENMYIDLQEAVKDMTETVIVNNVKDW